jgi:hypothetical protein
MKKKLWCGYLKKDGEFNCEIYYDQDLDKISKLNYIKEVFEPFFAKNKTEAIELIKESL